MPAGYRKGTPISIDTSAPRSRGSSRSRPSSAASRSRPVSASRSPQSSPSPSLANSSPTLQRGKPVARSRTRNKSPTPTGRSPDGTGHSSGGGTRIVWNGGVDADPGASGNRPRSAPARSHTLPARERPLLHRSTSRRRAFEPPPSPKTVVRSATYVKNMIKRLHSEDLANAFYVRFNTASELACDTET